MKRFVLGILVVAALAALFVSVKVRPTSHMIIAADNPFTITQRRTSSASEPLFPRPRNPSPEEKELTQLRDEYQRIASSKALLLSLEELRKAVPLAKKELEELRAKRELESVVEKLNQLIEKFPESEAAKKARELLGNPDPNVDFGEVEQEAKKLN